MTVVPDGVAVPPSVPGVPAEPAPPAVGEPAPDFTLEDQYGRPVTLSALRGQPVLLIFFPHAFSPICSSEFDELTEQEEVGALRGVTVLAVSCDPAEALREFADEGSVPASCRFASDFWPHGEVSRRYGVFFAPRGFPLRASFLLDADGVVRWSVVNGPGEARDTRTYVTALRALGVPPRAPRRADPLP